MEITDRSNKINEGLAKTSVLNQTLIVCVSKADKEQGSKKDKDSVKKREKNQKLFLHWEQMWCAESEEGGQRKKAVGLPVIWRRRTS